MKIKTKTILYFDEKEKVKFRKWLLEKNLTMQKFANKIGVSVSYISFIASGKKAYTEKARKLFKKGGYNEND